METGHARKTENSTTFWKREDLSWHLTPSDILTDLINISFYAEFLNLYFCQLFEDAILEIS
jgi:hypothetical protein